ncbi:hypothetical protein FOZ63_011768 [Perkinsus olseni]|uniref:Uncharacterized protein n=1 Tax=Perkinsus olseni TaxID=32597 RepID=A0A7J6RWE4_PEROL|nr:hypothetical protein FOZ63_011768 [Perkinsus olseni]
MRGFLGQLPPLSQVLLYAGDQDFLCNWLSVLETAEQLDWPGKSRFASATESPFKLPSSELGATVRAVGRLGGLGGLTFARVVNASHMVPQDAPEAALLLMNDFMYRKLGDDRLIIQKVSYVSLPCFGILAFRVVEHEYGVLSYSRKPLPFGPASLKASSLWLREETFTEAMFSTKTPALSPAREIGYPMECRSAMYFWKDKERIKPFCGEALERNKQ